MKALSFSFSREEADDLFAVGLMAVRGEIGRGMAAPLLLAAWPCSSNLQTLSADESL